MFDFPRVQIAVLTLLTLILAYLYVDFRWIFKLPLLLMLVASLVYQMKFVVVYTPLYKTQAKDSNRQTEENSFTLLVSNVLMENDDKESFHALVKKYNPDILLINEPDQVWAASISKLDEVFHIPKENIMPGKNYITFSEIPFYDSPVIIADKSLIPIK